MVFYSRGLGKKGGGEPCSLSGKDAARKGGLLQLGRERVGEGEGERDRADPLKVSSTSMSTLF